MIRLQRCAACGTAQYPPREFCGSCLANGPVWHEADSLPARVIARTVLYHSNEPRFRPRLPLALGLIRFDAGPIAVCFLPGSAQPGDAVQVRLNADNLLEAE